MLISLMGYSMSINLILILKAILILVLGYFAVKIVSSILENGAKKSKIPELVSEFVIKLFSAILYVFVILLAVGVFGVETGNGEIVGDEISKNDNVNMVSFTGSVEVGESISKNAKMKKVTLELGGNNPMIVLKDSDIKLAAKSAVKSKFLNAGQVCISVGQVLVEEEVVETFTKYVIEETKKLILGNPLDKNTDIGPLISPESALRIENLIKQSVSEGGELLIGGNRQNSLISPAVINIDEENILSKIETFGPILPILTVKDSEEAVNIANNSKYGLQAGLFTNNINNAMKIADELEYGGIMINSSPTFRKDNMPFGGVKKSGLGREGIKYTVEEMSETKTVVIHNI